MIRLQRIRETLAEQVAPTSGVMVATLEGFNARTFKQCWQSLVLLFRDVVDALSPIPTGVAGNDALPYVDATTIVIERFKVR